MSLYERIFVLATATKESTPKLTLAVDSILGLRSRCDCPVLCPCLHHSSLPSSVAAHTLPGRGPAPAGSAGLAARSCCRPHPRLRAVENCHPLAQSSPGIDSAAGHHLRGHGAHELFRVDVLSHCRARIRNRGPEQTRCR